MMKKATTKLLVLFLCPILLTAQENQKADSLLQSLRTAKQDTNKVKLLFSIADEFENSEPHRSLGYVTKARELSRELNYRQGILRSYRHAAYIYSLVSKFDSVILNNRQVYDMVKNTKDTFNIGVSLYNIGIGYRYLSDLDSAVEYILQGSRMLENKGYHNIEATINDGLQSLYYTLIQFDKAIVYGKKAVELARKLENQMTLCAALSNLGLSYVEKGFLEDARAAYLESLGIAEKNNIKVTAATVLNNLCEIAIREKKYGLIKGYAEKSILLSTETGDNGALAVAKIAMGVYHLTRREFAEAELFTQEALNYTNTNTLMDARSSAVVLYAEIAFAKHDFDTGFALVRQAGRLQSEIFNQSMQQKEAAMRIRYETEKKDSQIKLQAADIKQKEIYNYLLIGGALTLLIISLLSYRTYRQKQKLQQQRINELETEKQLAATEAVLKGEEQERTRLAKDLHDGLGGMLSGVKYALNTMKGNLIMTPDNAQAFERSIDMLDSSIREIRRVAHNMMPEALVNFGLDTALRDFCNDIDKSGALKVKYQSLNLENAAIDQTVGITIYRIVQELLNNTIKHAGANSAIVQVSKTGEVLSVTVEDDGKGFDTSILNKTQGIGWVNIQNRVEFLKGKMDVNSTPEKGTSVHIELSA
jgi:two-component system, NarL family, sensor kinase